MVIRDVFFGSLTSRSALLTFLQRRHSSFTQQSHFPIPAPQRTHLQTESIRLERLIGF